MVLHRNHILRRRSLGATAFVSLLAMSGGALGSDDTSQCVVTVQTDTPAQFKARVSPFKTTDNDDPADGFNGTAKVQVASTPILNWKFDIWHEATGWTQTAARNLKIGIQGEHLHGPHQPPWIPSDVDPNPLPKKYTGVIQFATYGKQYRLTMQKKVDHPTTGRPHKDTYALQAGVTADAGAPPFVNGSAVVTAKHEGKAKLKSRRYGVAFGSSMRADSTVTFDFPTQLLRLNPGMIDILDTEGGLTETVDPAYLEDPMQLAMFEISPLPYLGLDEYGRHMFGPGEIAVSMLDHFHIDSSFDVFYVVNTSDVEVLSSFALFDELVITNIEVPMGSPFLDDFADTNVVGEGLTEEEWESVIGIDLAFVTIDNLVDLTQGFRVSTPEVPATIVVSANWSPPCPADFDESGEVDFNDLLTILAAWGNPGGQEDLDEDGFVGMQDLLKLLASWGPCDE